MNPDLSLHDFNVMEQQRFDQMEASVNKFKEINSTRIKKGFIMVNRVFDQLDELKQNVNLYKDNLQTRKAIISEIKIDQEKLRSIDQTDYVSPKASKKTKSKKKKKSNSKNRKNEMSPKNLLKSLETNAEDVISTFFE